LLEIFRRGLDTVILESNQVLGILDSLDVFCMYANQASVAQVARETIIPFNCNLTNLFVNIRSNGYDGDTLYSIRDDLLELSLITITAGVSANFANTDVTPILAGSGISFHVDTTASTPVRTAFWQIMQAVLRL